MCGKLILRVLMLLIRITGLSA